MKSFLLSVLMRHRVWLLDRLLNPQQRAILSALECPVRWDPFCMLTPEEAKQWAELLNQPLLRKIDLSMMNLVCDQAQLALRAPSEETLKLAGHASGVRAGWEMAKALSTFTSEAAGKSEGDADTATPALAHLQP